MNTQIHKNQSQSGRITFAQLGLILIIGFAVVAGGIFFAFRWHTSKQAQVEREELRNKQAELERQGEKARAAQQVELAIAKERQNAALESVRTATNLLSSLHIKVEELAAQLERLKTGNEGILIAQHPDLVPRARQLFTRDFEDVPSVQETRTRLETARRFEIQIAEAKGTTFDASAFSSNITELVAWSQGGIRRVDSVNLAASALVREAKAKLPPKDTGKKATSLGDAISQLDLEESAQKQREIVSTSDAAKGQATKDLAKAEADKILAEARIAAEKITREASLKADAFKRAKDEEDAKLAAAKLDSELSVQKTMTEAKIKSFQAKAMQPDVQQKLAPFLAKGTWQPRAGSRAGEAVTPAGPMSFSRLKSFGALNSSISGLDLLARAATIDQDKMRPRWSYHSTTRKKWHEDPKALEDVQEAQALLIELGPTMVEMGLLSK
jgi:hypothetical protein